MIWVCWDGDRLLVTHPNLIYRGVQSKLQITFRGELDDWIVIYALELNTCEPESESESEEVHIELIGFLQLSM